MAARFLFISWKTCIFAGKKKAYYEETSDQEYWNAGG